MQDEIYLLNKDKSLYAVADLAGESDIAVTNVAPVATTQPVDFNYLGKNKAGFLILTHYPDAEYIEGSHLIALESILKRKDLLIDDVAIFNLAKYDGVSFEDVTNYFKPQKILLLGKNALPQNIISLKLNIPQQLANCTALCSFSFDEMMGSNDNKKAFWEQMKLL